MNLRVGNLVLSLKSIQLDITGTPTVFMLDEREGRTFLKL